MCAHLLFISSEKGDSFIARVLALKLMISSTAGNTLLSHIPYCNCLFKNTTLRLYYLSTIPYNDEEVVMSKVAVITGGARGIGKAIVDAMKKEGITVHIIDISEGDWFVGDVGDKDTLERFAEHVIKTSGHVDYLINNALPLMKGINDCSYEEFTYALQVGVTAAFYLTKLLMPYFTEGASVINIASSRDRMSQPQTESYTAAKGGIASLTHAMAISLADKARVNSISPGWIDTTGSDITGADAYQQPVGRVGKPEDIASMVMYLCSDKAGFITGENICIDGGMTRQMIYHGEHGWSLD